MIGGVSARNKSFGICIPLDVDKEDKWVGIDTEIHTLLLSCVYYDLCLANEKTSKRKAEELLRLLNYLECTAFMAAFLFCNTVHPWLICNDCTSLTL